MSLEELKKALSENTLYYGSLSSSAMVNIMKYVDIKLLMDKHTFDYYYTIDVEDLLNSEMPIKELETLKDQGWSLSKDNKNLILFIN